MSLGGVGNLPVPVPAGVHPVDSRDTVGKGSPGAAWAEEPARRTLSPKLKQGSSAHGSSLRRPRIQDNKWGKQEELLMEKRRHQPEILAGGRTCLSS